jgi:hypothetical protein
MEVITVPVSGLQDGQVLYRLRGQARLRRIVVFQVALDSDHRPLNETILPLFEAVGAVATRLERFLTA